QRCPSRIHLRQGTDKTTLSAIRALVHLSETRHGRRKHVAGTLPRGCPLLSPALRPVRVSRPKTVSRAGTCFSVSPSCAISALRDAGRARHEHGPMTLLSAFVRSCCGPPPSAPPHPSGVWSRGHGYHHSERCDGFCGSCAITQ